MPRIAEPTAAPPADRLTPHPRPVRWDLAARLVLMALLLFAVGAFARAAETSAGPPFRAVEDVVFGHKDGLALTYDVLTPEKDAKNIGVILVSSGGWKSSKSDLPEENEKGRRTEHWVRGLLEGGYTIFLVRHGSGTRYHVPEMTPDIRRAVRFIRLHAADYGVNPAKLGITSGSSGGHLSLMAALTADDGDPNAKDPVERVSSRVQAVVAWFPPTDLINWGKPEGWKNLEGRGPEFFEGLFGKVTDLPAQLRSISPIYFATPAAPPLLLLHGTIDTTVPLQQSEIMKAKYEELGLPVKLVVHEGGGHSFWSGIMKDYPTVWAWFDQYLK